MQLQQEDHAISQKVGEPNCGKPIMQGAPDGVPREQGRNQVQSLASNNYLLHACVAHIECQVTQYPKLVLDKSTGARL
jgi:hypothetical protein